MTYITLFLLTILCILFWLIVPFSIVGNLIGAPYYPSTMKKVKKMIKLAGLKKGMLVADLGSGDGRIAVEAAKKGVTAHGIELNPVLVLFSRFKFRKVKNLKFINKNMWDVDVSSYDRIFLFCLRKEMRKFESKLRDEMKPGSLIISNIFKFNNWKPVKVEDNIYVYKVK